MTATCPSGHPSATDDYCDQCGARIDGPAEPSEPAEDTSATPVSAPCPQCGTPRAGRDRYCEDCGFDFASCPAPPAAPAPCRVHVAPDRELFAATAPEGVSFPADTTPRTVVLDGPRVVVGRRRSGGDESADLELDDPAVSRTHATFVCRDDGSWAVVDEGSSNGTTLNGGATPIVPHVPIAVSDGDRVHVGAWTTITLELRSPAA